MTSSEYETNWPLHFMVLLFGVFLALLEGGLGVWQVFHGKPPMLALIFVYWVSLYHGGAISPLTGLLVGVSGDLLYSDLLGGRATCYVALILIMEFRRQRIQHYDFREIWVDFMITCGCVMLFHLVIFSAINLALPSIFPILFQIGITMLLYPIVHVLLSAMTITLGKLKAFR